MRATFQYTLALLKESSGGTLSGDCGDVGGVCGGGVNVGYICAVCTFECRVRAVTYSC